MKIIAVLAAFTIFALSNGHLAAQSDADKAENAKPGKTLYHVVSLKFKASATPEQIREVADAFAALKQKVPGITSLHWGTNVSPEHRNKGFTHCFVLTFTSQKDRDGYLVHPAHKAFGKLAGPVLDDVMVIDFWSQEK